MNNKHAYVRYDSKGKIVSGSLIIREEIPKVGIWREVPIDLCCSSFSTTTTTTIYRDGEVLINEDDEQLVTNEDDQLLTINEQ
jgi:hypothetical protein